MVTIWAQKKRKQVISYPCRYSGGEKEIPNGGGWDGTIVYYWRVSLGGVRVVAGASFGVGLKWHGVMVTNEDTRRGLDGWRKRPNGKGWKGLSIKTEIRKGKAFPLSAFYSSASSRRVSAASSCHLFSWVSISSTCFLYRAISPTT